MPALKEITVSGPLRSPEPVLLSNHDAEAYWALVDVFREQEEADEPGALPSIIVHTSGELILGRCLEEGDTLYHHERGVLGLGTNTVFEQNRWVRGERICSPAALGFPTSTDNDGHQTLVLESLPTNGVAMPEGVIVGVEIERTALTGLYVASRNFIPDGHRLLDPMHYVHGQ